MSWFEWRCYSAERDDFLTRLYQADCLVVLHFYLVAWRQEGVEAHYQVRVALEQVGDTVDDTRSVNAAREQRKYSVK